MSRDPALAFGPLPRLFALFSQDRELRYTWLFNPHAVLIPESPLGKTDAELFPPPAAAHLTALKQAVLATGQGKQELLTLDGDDSPRHYELLIEPQRGNDGALLGLTGTAIDVTECLAAAENLPRVGSFAELNPNPVAEVDEAGGNGYLNRAARTLFAGPDGAAWRAAFFAGFDAVRARVREAGSATREVAIGPNWFLQQWYQVPGSSRYRVYAVDVTARMQADAALRRAHDELEAQVARRTSQLLESNLRLKLEVAERLASERQVRFRNAILKLSTLTDSRQRYLEQIVRMMRGLSGCRCVGIRLVNPERQIPYDAYVGFSPTFWNQENCLQLDRDRCACIRVIAAAPLPSEQALVTASGSFICGDIRTLMESAPPELQGEYRGGCVAAGFQTVAIVPVRSREKIIGALHFADKRPDRLRPETRKLIESLAPVLGEMIHRFDLMDTIRERGELLEKLFANTHFSVVYLDRQFNFIRVNRAYAEIEGLTPEYFRGKNHFDLYPHAENQALFQRVVDTGEPVTVLAKPFVFPRHPEWGTTWWDWSVHPVKDAAGRVEGLIFCLVDATKRTTAELELQRTQTELNARQRLSDIGTLAATVAHELRNPLAAIKMAAYNLKRKAPAPNLASHLASIEKKVTESESIINNLLFYSRIKEARCEPLDLHALLLECAAAVRDRFPGGAAALKLQVEPLRGLTLAADPLQLRELFGNLLNNAFDALPEGGGAVELVAHRGDREITLEVRDTGEGIEPADLPRLFDAFFTTKAKGTGLGLTVCAQIAQNHRGTIAVKSVRHRGTTVTVVLPLAPTGRCAS